LFSLFLFQFYFIIIANSYILGYNTELYTTFNLIFIVIFFLKIIYKNKPLLLIPDLQQIMNSCEFKETIIVGGFEIENGLLGLDRDCYLSIVKFLDSSILRKV
jgi:hypothetical protein